MPAQRGEERLEAAQRAAGVPAALERLDDAGRALLLLSYRHGMPDSEIAARVGAAPALVATLREQQLEGLVTATGASSRADVIAWLEFVPEEVGGGAALVPAAAVAAAGPEGDVWREVKWMVAVLAAFLVLYAAAEFDPGSPQAPARGARGGEATRVAVEPDRGGERVPGGGREAAARVERGASRAPGGGAAAAARPAAGTVASLRTAAAPSVISRRGRQGVAGVVAVGGGR